MTPIYLFLAFLAGAASVGVGVALGLRSFYISTKQRLCFLNSPRGWHMNTTRILLEQIVAIMESDDAKQTDSYRDWLHRARKHLSRPMP